MGWRHTGRVWKYSKATGSDLVVMLAIGDSTNDDDAYAWLKRSTLARMVRTTERNLRYRVRRLVEMGELAVFANAGPGGSNLWMILIGDGGSLLPPPEEVQFPGGVKHSSPPKANTLIDEPSDEPSLRGRKLPRSRKKDPYGAPARELTKHLHDEYARVYDDEEDPLTEGFTTGLGHAMRLLKKCYRESPPESVDLQKEILSWWLEHWNDVVSPEFQRHDFGMAAFVSKYTVIRNRKREADDAKEKAQRH